MTVRLRQPPAPCNRSWSIRQRKHRGRMKFFSQGTKNRPMDILYHMSRFNLEAQGSPAFPRHLMAVSLLRVTNR